MVEELTLKFMRAVAYRGILDIGFRYDARDGQYKVLDVNPRIGATFRLFVGQNGIDVARALYLDLMGQPVPRANAREGRKWFVEDLDLVSACRYYHDGKLTIREWIASFRGVEEAAFLAHDDLLPGLPMVAARLVELLRRVYGFARMGLIRWIHGSPPLLRPRRSMGQTIS
jgi:predicted ATP-grasp superfamily ATP-dependent carboligase